MKYIICGCAAFLIFILHDFINDASGSRKGRALFFAGCGLLAVASAGLIADAVADRVFLTLKSVAFSIFTALFFVALIYTLFFALPFRKTYIEDGPSEDVSGGPNKVCDTGVYALCRHPGVLWLAGTYISLAIAFPGRDLIIGSVAFTLLDIVYVIVQDIYIFPHAFSDYDMYRKSTPFLLPTAGSVKRCFYSDRRSS